jgi:hypothetical protein
MFNDNNVLRSEILILRKENWGAETQKQGNGEKINELGEYLIIKAH